MVGPSGSVFAYAGGMAPAMFMPLAKPLSGNYPLVCGAQEIALMRARDPSMQEVARRLERAASRILRELRRNASIRSGA